MTKFEFHQATIEWAKSILSQPEYTMPNGKSSHQVAYAAINSALDNLIATGRINADGQFAA